jgi:hypothetical protein
MLEHSRFFFRIPTAEGSFQLSKAYERCPAKKAASLIEIETFGARSGNRPLLGFAFRNNTGKM